MWSCKAGRGRKIRAKVGGVSEGGRCIEENDKDEKKGKGKAGGMGKANAEERVEGKGKAQEGTNGEEKLNEREKEDAGDESVFDLDPPHGGKQVSALGSEDGFFRSGSGPALHLGLPLLRNRTRGLKLDRTRPLPSVQHPQPAKKP